MYSNVTHFNAQFLVQKSYINHKVFIFNFSFKKKRNFFFFSPKSRSVSLISRAFEIQYVNVTDFVKIFSFHFTF